MALELAPAGLQAGPATMTTIIIMLTEMAIGLEGWELTSRSRTPLSIAELTFKSILPVPLNASGVVNKLFLCLHHPHIRHRHAGGAARGFGRGSVVA